MRCLATGSQDEANMMRALKKNTSQSTIVSQQGAFSSVSPAALFDQTGGDRRYGQSHFKITSTGRQEYLYRLQVTTICKSHNEPKHLNKQ